MSSNRGFRRDSDFVLLQGYLANLSSQRGDVYLLDVEGVAF